MSTIVAQIYNYRQATPELATSGQPREDELAAIAGAGYDVIVNLALHDDPRYSLKDEAASVQALGLEYVHIPVQFNAPTGHDLSQFFEIMDRCKGRCVWVHCAANMRVTAFLGLYLYLREGWREERAFALMHEIWHPNQVWSEFIAMQLVQARTTRFTQTNSNRRRGRSMQALRAARRPESVMNVTDELVAALSKIPGVESGRSRIGSGTNRAWRIAGYEFAHLHSPSLIDLRLPRPLQAELRSDPRAHFRTGRSQWIELEFHSRTDVMAIAALARKAAAATQGRSKARRTGQRRSA